MSFKSIGDEISSLLGQWVDEPGSREAVVCGTWKRVVGEAAARRTQALSFESSTLTVEVLDRGWVPILEGMERDLIRRLNATLGRRVVRSIEWRLQGDEGRGRGS